MLTMAQPPDGNTANTGPSNLLAQAHGLATLVAMLHGKMLIEAAYKIKTNNGISTESYSHSKKTPAYGPGQGSKSGAHLWGNNASVYSDIHA